MEKKCKTSKDTTEKRVSRAKDLFFVLDKAITEEYSKRDVIIAAELLIVNCLTSIEDCTPVKMKVACDGIHRELVDICHKFSSFESSINKPN